MVTLIFAKNQPEKLDFIFNVFLHNLVDVAFRVFMGVYDKTNIQYPSLLNIKYKKIMCRRQFFGRPVMRTN